MEADEVAAMFDHSDNDKLTRFMILLLGCAGRPSATIEISGNSIDLNAGTIDLLLEGEAQTKKYRATGQLPSFIECLFHKDNLESQSHFIANLNNMRNRFWNRARDCAGLGNLVVPYSFRHTVAKWLRAEGVDA